ncbi:protein ATP1B4 isoform X2 [Hemicordylus capensis]|uniref:protein ATP1B4 isoform X2 n=1 Tax=Hemicordylus capensis TaxID=884348 RepID=UPI0023048DA9|nr:protein ATP1B4 isoform X2 [Hemicordylus capensis]
MSFDSYRATERRSAMETKSFEDRQDQHGTTLQVLKLPRMEKRADSSPAFSFGPSLYKGNMDGEDVQQRTREQEKAREKASFRKRMKLFFWNPETKQCMGRSCRSWGGILLFYLIFYAFLLGMFSLCMYVMLHTVSPYVPTYRDRVAPPGLMMRPYLRDFKVCFNQMNDTTWLPFVKNMERFLKGYDDKVQEDKNIVCTPGQYFIQDSEASAVKRACQFKRSMLMNCSGVNDTTFGYAVGEPCILLKMNRIVGYQPGYGGPVTVSCQMQKGDDSILPDIHFYPSATFDPMYYPYYGKLTHVNYSSPLVAVRFSNVKRDHVLSIQCQLNGEGIVNDHQSDKFLGRIIFKLKVS